MAYVFYQVFYTALVVVAVGYAAMETMDAGPIPYAVHEPIAPRQRC